MDRIAFPYRSSTHLTLLHVVSESGSWEKHGLHVDYDRYISSSEAHRAIPKGDVEFVGGNHVSTYGHRARGDKWVYLGQTVNYVDAHLVVRADSGIDGIQDLKCKKVGTRGSHPSLNDWLRLKKNGLDIDRDDVELINQLKYDRKNMDPTRKVDPEALEMPKVWEWVRDRVVDAAFVTPPSSYFAENAGLKVIKLDPMPMIWHTTISSSLDFVESHPDIAERLLKGLIEGIHFFKTRPDETIDILHRRYTKEGKMSREVAAATYAETASLLEPCLFPSMAAISNVYQEAVRQDTDARRVNPLELWDTHFLRRIVDSGFVAGLYGKMPSKQDHAAVPHGHAHAHSDTHDATTCETCDD